MRTLTELDDMVSVCAGLVAFDEEADILRLVHYTTQEYFERTKETWFPNADLDIATARITYLSYNEFESAYGITNDEFDYNDLLQRRRTYPLYDYASLS